MSISAPRMTIKSQLPWHVKAVFAVLGIAMVGLIAYLVYSQDQIPGVSGIGADNQRIAELTEQVRQLSEERDSFSSSVNGSESQLNIYRATEKQMATQVKALESENAKLKEDLAFFESLLPNNIGVQGITIQRLKAELTEPNQLHYRLLVMQGQTPNGVQLFVGNLQLSVNVQQQGQTKIISFPAAGNTDPAPFKLSFKYYQRLEGDLVLPDGATVKSVQARVLEKGQVRVQQIANL
jgi:archaellum component FlaC